MGERKRLEMKQAERWREFYVVQTSVFDYYSKSYEQIEMKFYGGDQGGTMKN